MIIYLIFLVINIVHVYGDILELVSCESLYESRCVTIESGDNSVELMYVLGCLDSQITCNNDDGGYSDEIYSNYYDCINDYNMFDNIDLNIIYICSNNNPYIIIKLDILENNTEYSYCGLNDTIEGEYILECSDVDVYSNGGDKLNYFELFNIIYIFGF
jgi:hypothetical protein